MVYLSKITSVAFFALFLVSCSDRPRHEKFPGGQGRTTDVQQAQTQRAVLGGFDPLNNPLSAGSSASMNGEKEAAGPTISGRIEIPAGAETGGKILFIFARSDFGGPPLAVKKLPSPAFPMNFSLSAADRMAPHTVFAGKVTVHARLDSDGDAWSTGAGDYSAETPAQVGDSGLVLKLELVK